MPHLTGARRPAFRWIATSTAVLFSIAAATACSSSSAADDAAKPTSTVSVVAADTTTVAPDDAGNATTATTVVPGTTTSTSTTSTTSPTFEASATSITAPVNSAPERFTGTEDEFYAPPDPFPAGEPGDLIRVMDVGVADGSVTVKVMYHSRDAQDRDRPVTGVITYPIGEAPIGGWPVVATAPGTTGIAPQCALSRILDGQPAPAWGVDGVRVITDYIGLGPTGGPLHPYLSKPSEGHSVIDGVRAAHNLAETHAGTTWLSVGHSQGGHGALSASELAADYAPELDLVGTLALAPAALLDRLYGGIDPIVTGILTTMSLYGGAGEHPEIILDDYVTPELAAVAGVMETGCLDEISTALAGLAAGNQLFTNDPRTTDPAKSVLLANDVGNVAVDAPLFLVSGTADDRVVIDRFRDTYARFCAAGQVTELLIVDGATHGSIIGDTAVQTAAWLTARLAGDEPTNTCDTSPTATG
ncbi:MAG: lipase family protein [Ilumatobacteraceae bacterium]